MKIDLCKLRGHDWSGWTRNGMYSHRTCSRCNQRQEDSTCQLFGHHWGPWENRNSKFFQWHTCEVCKADAFGKVGIV